MYDLSISIWLRFKKKPHLWKIGCSNKLIYMAVEIVYKIIRLAADFMLIESAS